MYRHCSNWHRLVTVELQHLHVVSKEVHQDSIGFPSDQGSRLSAPIWVISTLPIVPLAFEYLPLMQVYTFFRWRLYSLCQKKRTFYLYK